MKLVAINTNLTKVVPYVFKKLGSFVYETEYDEKTKVLSTDIHGNNNKLSVKYIDEFDGYYLIVDSIQINAMFGIFNKDNPPILMVSDDGDIYFEFANMPNLKIFVNKADTSTFNSIDMLNLFEVCELFGDEVSEDNLQKDIKFALGVEDND